MWRLQPLLLALPGTFKRLGVCEYSSFTRMNSNKVNGYIFRQLPIPIANFNGISLKVYQAYSSQDYFRK